MISGLIINTNRLCQTVHLHNPDSQHFPPLEWTKGIIRESLVYFFNMVNPKNTESKDRATRPSTERATVIQRQRVKKRQENRAKAREVRKAKEREARIPLVPSNPITKLNPKQQEGAWFFDLSSVLKWEEAPEITFGEGPHLQYSIRKS